MIVVDKKRFDGKEMPAAPSPIALLRLDFLAHIFLFIITADTTKHNQPPILYSNNLSLSGF
jgi:hypothetical protein